MSSTTSKVLMATVIPGDKTKIELYFMHMPKLNGVVVFLGTQVL
jgi:hypothetical protein